MAAAEEAYGATRVGSARLPGPPHRLDASSLVLVYMAGIATGLMAALILIR